jgi:hypothetical protein
MKGGKNVKVGEQKAVLRYLQHRELNGRESNFVRIRGHRKTETDLIRWARKINIDRIVSSEQPPRKQLMRDLRNVSRSLFPHAYRADLVLALIGDISIYTTSPKASLAGEQGCGPDAFALKYTADTMFQRLLQHIELPNRILECKAAQEVLVDFQYIFDYDHINHDGNCRKGVWDPVVEGYITELRNLMNMSRKVRLVNTGKL